MWRRIGGKWGKCEECWHAFENNIQHENSLHCFKLGIPISALKIPLEEFLTKFAIPPGKYVIFPFPLSLFSKGVIIFYFSSKEEMLDFVEKVKDFVNDKVNYREVFFYNTFVNVEWIKAMNWRRGCPEYDKKFGDWRSWRKS